MSTAARAEFAAALGFHFTAESFAESEENAGALGILSASLAAEMQREFRLPCVHAR